MLPEKVVESVTVTLSLVTLVLTFITYCTKLQGKVFPKVVFLTNPLKNFIWDIVAQRNTLLLLETYEDRIAKIDEELKQIKLKLFDVQKVKEKLDGKETFSSSLCVFYLIKF